VQERVEEEAVKLADAAILLERLRLRGMLP
jgi:hypothetical protein